jgi:hypothetical protein
MARPVWSERNAASARVTRDILRVDRTDAACPELAEADHDRAFGYCFKPTIRALGEDGGMITIRPTGCRR